MSFNLDNFSTGKLQDFLTLQREMKKYQIIEHDIEEHIKKRFLISPKAVIRKKFSKGKRKKSPARSDLFDVLPAPVLSQCCQDKVYLTLPSSEESRKRHKFCFICGNCNKEFLL